MTRRTLYAVVFALAVCGLTCGAITAGVWLDVPFVAQSRDGCGAASLSMVMQYWQRQQGRTTEPAADANRILKALYSRRAHGIYASAMVRYLREHGYRAFAFAGDWPMLEDHLRKGRPLIAALRPDGSRSLHYVVVVGVEPELHLVLVNDPEGRKLMKRDEATFEHEWKATNHWTLLAVPISGVH